MKQKGWNSPDNGRNHIIQALERVTQGHPDSVTQRQHSTNNTEITSLLLPLPSKASLSEARFPLHLFSTQRSGWIYCHGLNASDATRKCACSAVLVPGKQQRGPEMALHVVSWSPARLLKVKALLSPG